MLNIIVEDMKNIRNYTLISKVEILSILVLGHFCTYLQKSIYMNYLYGAIPLTISKLFNLGPGSGFVNMSARFSSVGI